MRILGLTGGVGMGKSTAENVFRKRNIPVVDTDAIARKIVEPGQPALDEVRDSFGGEFIGPSGNLDRGKLARLVFSDEAARRKLEAILHPRIRSAWMGQIENWRTEGWSVAVVVIPLLFETGAGKELTETVCVACSSSTQLARLKQRGWTDSQMNQRIASQWPIERKMSLSDYVAWSEGDVEILEEQIDRVLSFMPGVRA